MKRSFVYLRGLGYLLFYNVYFVFDNRKWNLFTQTEKKKLFIIEFTLLENVFNMKVKSFFSWSFDGVYECFMSFALGFVHLSQ